MKFLYALACLCACITWAKGQVTPMPAHTKAAIDQVQKSMSSERSVVPQHLQDVFPIYQHHGKPVIATLCRINRQFDRQAARDAGFEVGSIIGRIATIRIPLHMLREDFFFPGIDYIEVAEKIEPSLHRALLDATVDLVHEGIGLPQGYHGKNVMIGVADWGFDYTHPVFYDSTLTSSRIYAAWDQVKYHGTPPAGFSHGAVYVGQSELELAASDTSSSTSDYHGTHVAGIAGGNGAGTPYRGVGDEADLLFSQMRRDAGSSLDAFQWMYDMAQREGKRLVINNSWSSYRTNPLDGTSLISEAIDALSEQGVVFIFSGGNNGGINFHLSKSFQADSVKTRVMGFDYTNDHELWGQTLTMWGETGFPFTVQLRITNPQNVIQAQTEFLHTATNEAFVDTFMIIGTDTVFYEVITDAAHPLNGRPQMTINVQNKNPLLRTVLYAEALSGTVHFWNSRLTKTGGGNWGNAFTAPTAGYVLGDRHFGVGHPGITSSVITVAAHTTDGDIATFSSYGPRMDGAPKPDISAPGVSIISALSSYAAGNFIQTDSVIFNDREYEFIPLSGTSMSAPMVAGIVSLFLEAAPELSPQQIKELLQQTARQDGETGTIIGGGDVRWGWGKADAYAAISNYLLSSTEDQEFTPASFTPNPANDVLRYTGAVEPGFKIEIAGFDGKIYYHGALENEISIATIPAGTYVVTISGLKEIRRTVVSVVKH